MLTLICPGKPTRHTLTKILQYDVICAIINMSHAELYDDLLMRPLGALIVL